MDSGSRWTRCATSSSWKLSGHRTKHRGRSGIDLLMTPDFWRGKRVFLTGHTGLKGGWLSLGFQSLDAEVAGLALGPPTEPPLLEIPQVGAGMTSRFGDVRSPG